MRERTGTSQHEQHAPSSTDAAAGPEGPDLGFRPDYWNPADPVTAIVANIKGAVRRGLVVEALTREPGDPAAASDIPDCLRGDALEEGDRALWGRLHPAMMGGEYLPPYLKGEVEVARIVLMSTLMDVISIRARRRRGGRIRSRQPSAVGKSAVNCAGGARRRNTQRGNTGRLTRRDPVPVARLVGCTLNAGNRGPLTGSLWND